MFIPSIIFAFQILFYNSRVIIIGCSRLDFSAQLNNFNKQEFTLVAIDPRGYGQSIPPMRDWPLEFIQRDAEDAIELLKVRHFSLQKYRKSCCTGSAICIITWEFLKICISFRMDLLQVDTSPVLFYRLIDNDVKDTYGKKFLTQNVINLP